MRPDAGHGMAEYETSIPPPPRPIEYRDIDAGGWWLSILGGTALAMLGVWMLTNPFRSVVILAVLVGISLIVSGVVEILARGGPQEIGWPAWIAGGLLVATGALVLAWPERKEDHHVVRSRLRLRPT